MANPQRPRTAALAQRRPQRRRRLVIRRSGRRAASSPRATASSPTPSSAPPRKRPVRARVARTRRPAHAGRPGCAYSSPTVRCGGRIAGLAVSPGIARDSGRRHAARSLYLESPPCWTPAIRNFCSPGRKTCVPRCSSSPTPTATSWCATPPIARSPCSSWGGQAHASVLLAAARLRRRGLRTVRQHGPAQRHHLPLSRHGLWGVQIRFRVQRPDVIHFDDGSAAWCRPSPTAWRGSSGARCSAPR